MTLSPAKNQSSTTETIAPKLYKILVNGQSAHGGSLTWSLPTRNDDGSWTFGGWHEIAGVLNLCSAGLHLTTQPIEWYLDGASLYLAEYDGEMQGDPASDSKVCVRRCRLIAEADWSDHQVYHGGIHVVRSGNVRAYDTATVRAYDTATVEAYDSATVRAYDSATVEASGSATVRAYDSATVEASDSATVRAYDSATVRAYDTATVRAYDSATVEASDSATVISGRWHSNSAQVALSHLAAHVDRRGGRVVCRTAEAVS